MRVPDLGVVLASAQADASRWPLVLAGLYCVAIVLASLAGGWLPLMVRLTHTRMQVSMSLCGGLMLGIGLLHMLPHAVEQLGSIDRVVGWATIGLLSMFFLIRAFHFHQHEPFVPDGLPAPEALDKVVGPHDRHGHSHEPAGGAAHHHHHPSDRLSWVGVVLGLGLHTMLDGVALAASVETEAEAGGTGWLLGCGTFLAILLHKPLDTMPIAILLRAGNTPRPVIHAINGGFAVLCPVGVLLFFLGFEHFLDHQKAIVGCTLAFSAGVFLCISLSDLLPELEFHTHDRLKLSLALLIGVAIAYAIGYVEPEGAHGHTPSVEHALEIR